MSNLRLNDDGDLDVVNNNLILTTGQEAIKQDLQTRLKTFLSEWFLDISEGVPYYQEILVKQPSFTVVSDVLKTIILETPGVLELTNFVFDYLVTRELHLEFTAETIDGPIDFSLLIGV